MKWVVSQNQLATIEAMDILHYGLVLRFGHGHRKPIEKEPSASLKHSHWQYYTGLGLRFVCVLLVLGCVRSRWVKTRDKVQNASETTHSVIRP